MRIDDLIILGRTVPEDSKKYGIKVCAAGYSPEMRSFIRIYPLPILNNIKAREMITIEVERNTQDSRFESWALKTRNTDSILNYQGQISKIEIRRYLEKEVKTVDQLNIEKASLGVISPKQFDVIMKNRTEIQDPSQLTLFNDFEENFKIKTAGDYYKIPYLKTQEGKQRCFQLREWGVYELMRKYPEKITAEYIKKALFLDKTKDTFFIIGNMNHCRTVWLVIKSFSFEKKYDQLTMF